MIQNENTSKLINELKKNSDDYRPLKGKEEKELILKYKDSNPELLAQLLINHNIRMVIKMASKYSKTCDNFDDLVQNGLYGLVLATKNFDLNRDIKFCTYAGFYIKKFILKPFYTPYSKHIKGKCFSLDSAVKSTKMNNESDTPFLDICDSSIAAGYEKNSVCPIENDLTALDQKSIFNIINSEVTYSTYLDDLDKEVYEQYYLGGKTIKEISSETSIKDTIIYKCTRKVVKFIKTTLSEKYNINNSYELGL